MDNEKYVIVRTVHAGVFFGILISQNGQEVVLKNARRLWYWSGAASLSELAMNGVKNPDDCKFPCAVDEIKLFGTIEIINTTDKAIDSIQGVKEWTA